MTRAEKYRELIGCQIEAMQADYDYEPSRIMQSIIKRTIDQMKHILEHFDRIDKKFDAIDAEDEKDGAS